MASTNKNRLFTHFKGNASHSEVVIEVEMGPEDNPSTSPNGIRHDRGMLERARKQSCTVYRTEPTQQSRKMDMDMDMDMDLQLLAVCNHFRDRLTCHQRTLCNVEVRNQLTAPSCEGVKVYRQWMGTLKICVGKCSGATRKGVGEAEHL